MIGVKHLLSKVSLYLWLGLLLYSFKSIQYPSANPRWRSDVGDGLQTPRSRFDSYFGSSDLFPLKIEETYTFMNISWAEMSRNLEISSNVVKS